MRFKHLFLSSSLIAAATIFSYCSKEKTIQEPNHVVNDTKEVVSRVACDISIQTNGAVDVCGVQNNANMCGVLNNNNMFGNDFIPSGGIGYYTVDAPTNIQVTRTAASQAQMSVSVKIETRAGTFEFEVPANSPLKLTVGSDCVVQ